MNSFIVRADYGWIEDVEDGVKAAKVEEELRALVKAKPLGKPLPIMEAGIDWLERIGKQNARLLRHVTVVGVEKITRESVTKQLTLKIILDRLRSRGLEHARLSARPFGRKRDIGQKVVVLQEGMPRDVLR